MRISKSISIFIFLVIFFTAADVASAGLRVAGAIVEKGVAPGDHFTQVINVSIRTTDEPMDLLADVIGYSQSINGDNLELNASQDTSPYSARSFLRVLPESFHLAPGESKDVTLEGDIPNDASPGGRYAIVKIQSIPKTNSTVGISVAIDVPVRLTITGPGILDKGDIESIELQHPISAKDQNITIVYKNTGNHHYKIKSELVAMDKDGQIVANASSPLSNNVLPTTSWQIEFHLKPLTDLKPGAYSLNATIEKEDGSLLASKEVQFEIKS